MAKTCSCCFGSDNHKDFIRGGVDVSDFADEFRHVRVAKKKRAKAKTRPGCPENNFKSHIYVWTTEKSAKNFFYDYYGFFEYEKRVCAGCGKVNGSRHSEEYEKVKARRYRKAYGDGTNVMRGETMPRYSWASRGLKKPYYRWWRWEYQDKDYMAARRAYREKHGWVERLY